MRIFISGGCKNGKSYYAQHLAKAQQRGRLYYVATMRPVDGEDGERIARHRRERDGWGFETVEQPVNIAELLTRCDHDGAFLLDSLTALLANEMFPPGGGVNERAGEKIARELAAVLDRIRNIVIVSDYIYSDAMRYDPLTERYRMSLAGMDRAAAEACDAVLEVTFTGVTAHKGGEAYLALAQTIR